MNDYPQFPKDFLFGSATAAYQIEGGWDEDDKGRSIWDVFSHRPGKIAGGVTGDVACDTYHDFQTDIDIMADLGLNAYRFSVAWSRVLPEGAGLVNQAGLDYYDRLVDSLLAKGITPFITLYHWDMPWELFRRFRGFVGRETAYHFADYAEVVVRALGDRVTHWITLNEPFEHAALGHLTGEHAPGVKSPGAYMRVAHHQLLGHGLAVPRIRELSPDAIVGVTLSQHPVYPFEENDRDRSAVEFADMFMNRLYMDGVFRATYPEKLLSRLWPFRPKIRQGDMEAISAPIDFLGVNYYTRQFARYVWYLPFFRSWVERDPPPRAIHPVLGPQAFPEGLSEILRECREDYGNPAIYITENGCIDIDAVVEPERVRDEHRINYLKLYLAELEKAIAAGSDVRGYFMWSMMDNFEWALGYDARFGFVRVDHDTQKRTIKDSAYWFRDMIRAQKSR